jgi:hypothetical protein
MHHWNIKTNTTNAAKKHPNPAADRSEKGKKNNTRQDACMQIINRLIEKRKIWMHACNYNK